MDWAELILSKNYLVKACLEFDIQNGAVRFDFVIDRTLPKGKRERVSITVPMDDLTPQQLLKGKNGMENLLREVFKIDTDREDLSPEVQFLEQADTSPYLDELEESDIEFVKDDG